MVVGLAVEPLACGGDGTTGYLGRGGPSGRCARPAAPVTAPTTAGQFCNAGPDCYWPHISATSLSISEAIVDRSSGVVRLTVQGELDLATLDRLADVLAAHLAAGHRTVCVDLSGLIFCAVSGINVLLTAHRAYQAAGSVLILTGCDRHLRRYLRLTGLDRVLNVADPSVQVGTDEARPEG